MKEITLTTTVRVCSFDELEAQDQALIEQAKAATRRSYAPYSQFQVGAAVRLEGGVTVEGCNQENAAYPSGLCAERTTLFYANAQYPDKAVEALAIAAYTQGDFTASPITPCGACRQVILETEHRFQRPIRILLYSKTQVLQIEGIEALLPLTFVAESLTGK
jgi:cytidine deaminase